MTARRLADLERSYALVDLGVVFALAAWIPQGFTPWWLPALGASAGWCAAVLWRLAGRAFGRRTARRARGRTLHWSGEAFSTVASGAVPATRVRWADVDSVFVYRRDVGVTREIVLAFVLRDGDVVELEDGLRGWVDVASDLPNHLAGCEPLERWFVDAVRQAPAPNARRVFGALDGFVPPPPRETLPARVRPAAAIRTYLAHGTVAILIAAAVLLVAAALVRREAELGSLGFAILAYAALSRLAVWYAFDRARERRP